MYKRDILIFLICSLGLLSAFVGGIFGLVVFIESATRHIDFSPFTVRIALSGTFLAGALILYTIKKSKAQFAYGLIEIAAGIVSNWLSLDSWFAPVISPAQPNIIYARLGIISAGIYITVRGITNVVEGFDRFFPKLFPRLWAEMPPSKVREIYINNRYAPRTDIPKDQLIFQIWSAEEQIAKREKKLAAAVEKGKQTKYIEKELQLIREELRIAKERYENEVEHSRKNI